MQPGSGPVSMRSRGPKAPVKHEKSVSRSMRSAATESRNLKGPEMSMSRSAVGRSPKAKGEVDPPAPPPVIEEEVPVAVGPEPLTTFRNANGGVKSWAQYNEDVARAKEARNQDRANRHANNIQGAPLGDVDGDTVEGVLESIVQKVAMELADEIERAEAAVELQDNEVHDALADIVLEAEKIYEAEPKTQEHKDRVYMAALNDELKSTGVALDESQAARRKSILKEWNNLTLQQRSDFVKNGVFQWALRLREIEVQTQAMFPAGGDRPAPVSPPDFAEFQASWTMVEQGAHADMLLKTLFLVERMEIGVAVEAKTLPEDASPEHPLHTLKALVTSVAEDIVVSYNGMMEVHAVLMENIDIVATVEDLVVASVGAWDQMIADEQEVARVLDETIGTVETVESLLTVMVEAVATQNFAEWDIDEISISDAHSESEAEEDLRLHLDEKNLPAWQLFPGDVAKPAEAFDSLPVAPFTDKDESPEPDDENDSDVDDETGGGRVGTVRDLFVTLRIPVSYCARLEEARLQVDDIAQMSADDLKKFIADKNIRAQLVEYLAGPANAAVEKDLASVGVPDSFADIFVAAGLDVRTAERFELEDQSLVDLADMNLGQLKDLIPRKNVRERFHAWVQRNKAELKRLRPHLQACDTARRAVSKLDTEAVYADWEGKHSVAASTQPVKLAQRQVIETMATAGPSPKTSSMREEKEASEEKQKRYSELDAPVMEEGALPWESLLRAVERGNASLIEVKVLPDVETWSAVAKHEKAAEGDYVVASEQMDLAREPNKESFDPEQVGLRRTLTELRASGKSFAHNRPPDAHARMCSAQAVEGCIVS